MKSKAVFKVEPKKKSYTVKDKRIPLDFINILPQPRRSFFEIEVLADDIALKGLINPITLALFTKAQCVKHLKVINAVWGTGISVRRLKSHREKYFVLIAGERRLRACRKLQKEGCSDHSPHGCYKLHIGDERIKTTVCFNISPIEALKLQASENIHFRPPAHEEAEFYDKFFRMLYVASGGKLSYAAFARFVGRSPEVIRNAIRFAKLPEAVRELVCVKHWLPYGIACELARLQEAGIKENGLMEWALNAVVKRPKVEDFRKTVSTYLKEWQSPQSSFLGEIFSKEQEREMKRMSRRRSIGQGITWALYASITYFRRVLDLFERGLLGKKDSPFLLRGPLRAWREQLELLKKLLPHFRQVLKTRHSKKLFKDLKAAEQILKEAERHTEQLEKVVI